MQLQLSQLRRRLEAGEPLGQAAQIMPVFVGWFIQIVLFCSSLYVKRHHRWSCRGSRG
jgi:hypothetical protein